MNDSCSSMAPSLFNYDGYKIQKILFSILKAGDYSNEFVLFADQSSGKWRTAQNFATNFFNTINGYRTFYILTFNPLTLREVFEDQS